MSIRTPMKAVSPARFSWPLSAGLILATASMIFAQTTEKEFKTLKWDKSHAGTPLDLARYQQTFIDNFDTLSVTPDGGAGPWFAPVHGPFGEGKFFPPGPEGPFSVAEGNMTIRAEKKIGKDGKPRWTSGLMQTVDSKGKGFAQKNGYFEMKAKMPPGPGGWPAFWLLSQNGFLDKTKPRAEIDIIEWYGGDPKGLHATTHIWPGQGAKDDAIQKNVHCSFYHSVAPILKDKKLDGFHTYGTELTPEWVIIYFDRCELGRFKMLPEWQTPLYMLVDLAIFSKEADIAESPKELVVDYVAAYAVKEGAK